MASAKMASAKMAQFDVFANPIAATRRAYPLVVALQSDFAQYAREQIVAPLVPQASMPNVISRMTPIVALEGSKHLVLVPALTGMRASDLKGRHGSLASARSELLAAIDFLFFGV
jgi:toxin CcdB